MKRQYINNHGLRLLTEFEGTPRLKARLCEGGRYELSYGVTFYPDGSPVKEGDTCTDDEALDMFRHALEVFEKGVSDLVEVDLNSNQFSACVALAYNIGLDNFRRSTVLREINARRFHDAAEAFGMWVFATKNGYTQAYRGLARRQYASSCLFLSYDWTEACRDDAIALQRRKPDRLPGRDVVLYKTPFHEVLKVAQDYPLPPPAEPADALLFDPAPKPAPEAKSSQAGLPDSNTPTAPSVAPEPVAGAPEPLKPPAQTVPASPAKQEPAAIGSGTAGPAGPIVAPQPKAPPVPAPPPPKDAAPASIEPKDMVLSKRFWGLTVTALGTTNLLPQAAQTWVNNEGNRELVTWLIVVAIGFALYKYGQHKAHKPLK